MTSYAAWNYRVIKRILEGESAFGIYEVYYDDSGAPSACSSSPCEPFGETPEDLKIELDMMRKATEQPTLNYDDFSRDE